MNFTYIFIVVPFKNCSVRTMRSFITSLTLNSGSTVYFIFWSFDNNLSSYTRSQVSSNRDLKSLATCAANNVRTGKSRSWISG